MLPARHRLRTRPEFTAATRGPGSARAGSRLLVVHAHLTDTSGETPSRVGFVVSSAVGGAVRRNTVKRRLREAMRPLVVDLGGGFDVVVRAQPAAATATFTELSTTLRRLLGLVEGTVRRRI